MQSQGITLGSNATSFATAMVQITGLTKIPFPTRKLNTVDMTDLSSLDNWEELELSLLKRGGELEFEYNTTQARLEAIDVIILSEVINYYKITIPGTTKSIWFKGLMTEHMPGEASLDAKVVGKFKITTTGKISFQAAAPT
jgi:hypothetical protein